MTIILDNCTMIARDAAVSVSRGTSVIAKNSRLKANIAVEEREEQQLKTTEIIISGKKIEIEGQWSEKDITSFVLALNSQQTPEEIGSRSRIGDYFKEKIKDPVAFAAQLTAITRELFN